MQTPPLTPVVNKVQILDRSRDYRSGLRPHFAEGFRGSDTSNVDIFAFAFSMSDTFIFGVGGTSSILVRPFEDLLDVLASFGNSDLRGVRAVTTFFADLRMLALISQDLFLAI